MLVINKKNKRTIFVSVVIILMAVLGMTLVSCMERPTEGGRSASQFISGNFIEHCSLTVLQGQSL